MSMLIAGIVVFFLIHMVPWSKGLRDGLVARLGFNGYRGLFSIVALGGLVLMVMGMRAAPFTPLYEPPADGLGRLLVLVAFVLFPAAHMKTNIRRFTRHPMLWGLTFWAAGHLLANGDVASVVLFGGLGLFGLVNMASANLRGAQKSSDVYPLKSDIMVLVAGSVVYLVVMWLHGSLFGYPLW